MSWSPVLGRTRISLTWTWCCFCLRELLLLRVLELAEVDDLADRRALVGSDLDQVETRLASRFQGLARRHDAEHGAFGVDDPHG